MLRRSWFLIPLTLLGCADLVSSLGGGATVSGVVKAPSTQQAGIFAGGAYRSEATLAGETALASASVQAYSTTGLPIGGSANTTSSGGFEIKGLPANRVFFLVATSKAKSGGDLKVSALIKPGMSAIRDLNTSSTVVAEKLKTLGASKLDALAQADVDSLEGTVAANMDTADIPDLTLPSAAVTTFDRILAKSSQLSASFQAISGTKTTASLR